MTATITSIGHTAYSLDGETWVDLPVGPRFDDPQMGLDEVDIEFRTDGGVYWVNREYVLDHWEFTFRVTLSQLANFRALHDLVDGPTTPFYFTLDRTESPIVSIFARKEKGFVYRGTGGPRNPPVFEYRLILMGEIDPLTVLA
jgi:hypothetical protein